MLLPPGRWQGTESQSPTPNRNLSLPIQKKTRRGRRVKASISRVIGKVIQTEELKAAYPNRKFSSKHALAANLR